MSALHSRRGITSLCMGKDQEDSLWQASADCKFYLFAGDNGGIPFVLARQDQ